MRESLRLARGTVMHVCVCFQASTFHSSLSFVWSVLPFQCTDLLPLFIPVFSFTLPPWLIFYRRLSYHFLACIPFDLFHTFRALFFPSAPGLRSLHLIFFLAVCMHVVLSNISCLPSLQTARLCHFTWTSCMPLS